MLPLVAVFAYPIVKMTFSLTGTNDFLTAGNHLLHGRIKKMVVSTVIGGTRLGFLLGTIYIVTKPLFVDFSESPNEHLPNP